MKIALKCSLFFLFCVMTGCRDSQTNVQITQPSQNTKSLNHIKTKEKLPKGVLFKGESMTVIEEESSSLNQLYFNADNKSCLNKVKVKIEKELDKLALKETNKYFELKTLQSYNFGPEKFIVNFDKKLFQKLSFESLEKLDKYASYTIFRYLYYIENNKNEYLVLIGQESATSGLGHSYSSHLIIPLDSKKATFEFTSISDDPRRIRISEFGEILITQIEFNYTKLKKDTFKNAPLIISLFQLNTEGNKKLKAKFDMTCEDLGKVLDEKRR